MSEQLEVPLVKKPRLQFIDIARSIAILLMLEGHFVDLTLGEQFRSPDPHFVNPDYLAYDIWHLIRGYTSPMFLTMTGMVFVYLLYRDNALPFFSNNRVKRGWERIFLLLFWGYLLNPLSFHVLQCIGYGIFGILAIYGLYKLVRIIPLWIWYFTAGFIVMILWAPLDKIRDLDGNVLPWPTSAPLFIQNMFRNNNGALFPLAPNLGYTFFGAGFGVLLHAKWLQVAHWRKLMLPLVLVASICTFNLALISISLILLVLSLGVKKQNWNLPFLLLTLGLFFIHYLYPAVHFLHFKVFYKLHISLGWIINSNWLFETLGWVLVVLAILSGLEKVISFKDNIFIKVGQNTLAIFVVHMMVLYGAVIQFGIRNIYSKTKNPLDPYEAAFGALIFILAFVLMVKYLDVITKYLTKLFKIIFPFLQRNL